MALFVTVSFGNRTIDPYQSNKLSLKSHSKMSKLGVLAAILLLFLQFEYGECGGYGVTASVYTALIYSTAFICVLLVNSRLFVSCLLLALLVKHCKCACQCKDVGDSFIVTRLWNIDCNSELSPLDVINEFEDGFAPIVTKLDGFQEYLSAFTGDKSTVFFFNIFETAEQAVAAQNAAVDFVQQNDVLNGNITRNQFTESTLSFHVSSNKCITKSIKGKYLSTRLWKLTEDSAFTPQGVVDEFEYGFAPQIQKADGFMEYGGAVVTGTIKTFFYNVFEDADGARDANIAAAQFVQDGALNGNIEPVVFTEGLIGFDYTCLCDGKQAYYAGSDNNIKDTNDPMFKESEHHENGKNSTYLLFGNILAMICLCAAFMITVFWCYRRRKGVTQQTVFEESQTA